MNRYRKLDAPGDIEGRLWAKCWQEGYNAAQPVVLRERERAETAEAREVQRATEVVNLADENSRLRRERPLAWENERLRSQRDEAAARAERAEAALAAIERRTDSPVHGDAPSVPDQLRDQATLALNQVAFAADLDGRGDLYVVALEDAERVLLASQSAPSPATPEPTTTEDTDATRS